MTETKDNYLSLVFVIERKLTTKEGPSPKIYLGHRISVFFVLSYEHEATFST